MRNSSELKAGDYNPHARFFTNEFKRQVEIGFMKFWENTQVIGFDKYGNAIRSDKPRVRYNGKGRSFDIN